MAHEPRISGPGQEVEMGQQTNEAAAPVDVLAVIGRAAMRTEDPQRASRTARGAAVREANAKELREARAAVAELIEAASRHIHAIDHPVNDGDDATRQARTLRVMSAALARVQGGAA